MTQNLRNIPRPLVIVNQWFIVISVATAWISGLNLILAIPLVVGLMGLFMHYNPIMKFANLFLSKDHTKYIPEDWDQQQFNQTIAVICLTLSLISFALGWNIAGYIFSAMVATAAFVAILGFCIGCFIRFQYQQYKYRKSMNH